MILHGIRDQRRMIPCQKNGAVIHLIPNMRIVIRVDRTGCIERHPFLQCLKHLPDVAADRMNDQNPAALRDHKPHQSGPLLREVRILIHPRHILIGEQEKPLRLPGLYNPAQKLQHPATFPSISGEQHTLMPCLPTGRLREGILPLRRKGRIRPVVPRILPAPPRPKTGGSG